MINTQSPIPASQQQIRKHPADASKRGMLCICCLLVILVGAIFVSACGKKTKTSPPPTAQVVPTATSAAAVPATAAATPTPMPFMPALQNYLSPRSRLIHAEEADVDDDGVNETIILYQDTSSYSTYIRGMVAEPPTAETPTPDPTSEDSQLSDVYWLGPGAAEELFSESLESVSVSDINDDGLSEIVLRGMWDANTQAIHIYQKSDLGFESLLSLISRGEISQQVDAQGQTWFSTVEQVFPRSGVVKETHARWTGEIYQVKSDVKWTAGEETTTSYPETTLLRYYTALAIGDVTGAVEYWSPGFSERAANVNVQTAAKSVPDLQLQNVQLLIESEDSARAGVSLRWTDAETGETRQSEGDTWDLVKVDDQWVLDRLNSTPLDVDWHLFTVEDGLAGNDTEALAWDALDRMWIGSANSGLTVWDGTFWSQIQAREDGPISDSITDLAVDADGILWIASQGGITRWNGMRWQNYTTSHGLPSDEVRALAVANDRTVWAATEHGIAQLQGETWHPTAIPEETSGLQITDLEMDAAGDIWISFTRDGDDTHPVPVARLSGDEWDWPVVQQPLSRSSVTELLLGDDGRLWAASDQGLLVGSGQEWELIDLSSAGADGSVHAIDEDNDGRLWAASDEGLLVGSGQEWVLHRWPEEMPGILASEVLVGLNGTVFLATESGLLKFAEAVPLQVLGGGL